MKPYVIGLTGNIASGKSVVRQYLENAGALTIDADLIAQDTYLPGAPAWQPILDLFGEDLKGQDGQINRGRLGRVVFSDPQALEELEKIIHPHVWKHLETLIENAKTPLIVIEAIKLLNTHFAQECNEIWVTTSPEEVRIQRLIETRGLTEADARLRVNSQEAESEKVKQATRSISTDTSFRNIFEQVNNWVASIEQAKGITVSRQSVWKSVSSDQLEMVLATLRDSLSNVSTPEDLCRLLSQTNLITTDELLALFSHLHFLTLLHRVIPRKTTLEQKKSLVAELEQIAILHSSETLIVKQEWLIPSEAKSMAFLPGESWTPNSAGFIYRDVLRKQGLMPGEVYRKPIFP